MRLLKEQRRIATWQLTSEDFMKRDEVILPYEILSTYKCANFSSFGFLPPSFSFKLLENPGNKRAMQIIPHASDSKLLAESGLFTPSTDVEQHFSFFCLSQSSGPASELPLLRLCLSTCHTPFSGLLYRLPIKALRPSYLFSISQPPFWGSDSSRHERWRSKLLEFRFRQPGMWL